MVKAPQSTSEGEEVVVFHAVTAIACLCERGLFRKAILLDVARKTVPLLAHPNAWIRYGVVSIFDEVAKHLQPPDVACFLLPLIRPFLLSDILDITEPMILECLDQPVCVLYKKL